MLLLIIVQGEQLTSKAFNQGKISQDAYQHYLEQTTQIMDVINQSIQQQGQLGVDAVTSTDTGR
jgi:methionine synthase II (cobalamin-independent)